MKRKLLTIILAIFIMLGSLCTMPIKVKAANEGTSQSNPIIVTFGKNYIRKWDNRNYNSNCYHKITITDKGILKLNFTKPIDDKGNYCSIGISIMDEQANTIWRSDTVYAQETFLSYYEYYVGLNKGIYYINLCYPKSLNVDSGIRETEYSFTFTKNNYCEIKPNGTEDNATKLELNKMYQAYLGSDTYISSKHAYFKINLKEGRNYKISISNYSAIKKRLRTSAIYAPNGNHINILDEFTQNDKDGYYNFTANYTGEYYIAYYYWNYEQIPYKIGIYEVVEDIKNAKIELDANLYEYTGKNIEPNIKVTYNGKILRNNKDYKITYLNNKNIGTGTIQLTGIENYKGTTTKQFLIAKRGDINKDGKIDTKDARLTLLAYVGKQKFTAEQIAIADVNKDGKVDTKDARQILLFYVGKIKNF